MCSARQRLRLRSPSCSIYTEEALHLFSGFHYAFYTSEEDICYQGVLQVAVALHHWRNGNFGGAIRLLKSGVEYLSRVSAVCQWVDVAALIAAAGRVRQALEKLGTEDMAALDPSLIPVLKVVDLSEEQIKNNNNLDVPDKNRL